MATAPWNFCSARSNGVVPFCSMVVRGLPYRAEGAPLSCRKGSTIVQRELRYRAEGAPLSWRSSSPSVREAAGTSVGKTELSNRKVRTPEHSREHEKQPISCSTIREVTLQRGDVIGRRFFVPPLVGEATELMMITQMIGDFSGVSSFQRKTTSPPRDDAAS